MEKIDGVEFDYEYLESGVNINHFFVEHTNRRNGIGSEVLNNLVSRFSDEGYEYVVINMGGGEDAVQFLQSNDFEIVEKEGEHVTAETEL